MSLVPIFPLPETVFFPSELLPLHLFEPRYRQMAEDTIARDRQLVVVLLRPGWEEDYYGNPPVHDVATMGHIDEHEKLPDGRFNIVLRGIERVRLVTPQSESAERFEGRLYRARETRPLPESPPPPGVSLQAITRRLRELEGELAATTQTKKWASRGAADFRELVNTLSATSDIPASTKQQLLEEGDILKRAIKLEALLVEHLKFWRLLAHYRERNPKDPTLN
jgi:Lon protease-like protein